MTCSRIVLGIATIFIITLIAGCKSSALYEDTRDTVGPETLSDFRIGATSILPDKQNLVCFDKEDQISLDFLKGFNPENFEGKIGFKIDVSNPTRDWNTMLSMEDLKLNGSIFMSNNDNGGTLTFNADHPLNFSNGYTPIDGFLVFGETPNRIYPGDELDIEVSYGSVEFADEDIFSLGRTNYHIYASSDVFERQVSPNNLSSDGAVDHFMIGTFEMSDQEINLVPLDNVNTITLDLGFQVNPYKIIDLINFRIIVNNLFTDEVAIFDRGTMFDNGELIVVDYVEGQLIWYCDHDLDFYWADNQIKTVANPGDLLEIEIDFIQGEDMLENNFELQNKSFRVFFLG